MIRYLIFILLIFSSFLTASSQTADTSSLAVLKGHKLGITKVQFSADGALIASSSLDGTVRIWSTNTRKLERILTHGAEVYGFAFAPDGKLIVTGGYDSQVKFWEVNSGKLQRTIKFPDWVNSLGFLSNGQLLVGCSDGIIRFVESKTGVIVRTLETKKGLMNFDISADGRYLATSVPIQIWDISSGKLLSQNIRGFGQNGLNFSLSGKFLASAEGTGGVKIFLNPTGELKEILRIEVEKTMLGPGGFSKFLVNIPATAIAFSPNEKWLATGDTDFVIQLWQIADNTISKTALDSFAGHTMTVTDLSFSPDGKKLASASLDRNVRLWGLK